MKKNSKKSNKKNKAKELNKKNLSITNQGDLVIIRNRSAIAASLLGVIMLGVLTVGASTIRGAWELPLFWLVFGLIILCLVYSFAKMIFAKVVLDSPKMTITVYNPTPITYKFEDVNYIDLKSVKAADGTLSHVVTVYIGEGRRTVELVSYSREQAEELSALLCGMLDNGAMEYPEGNEGYYDCKEENGDEYTFIKRGKKADKDQSEAKENAEAPACDKTNTDKENTQNE